VLRGIWLYPAAVIPLSTQHYTMLARNLLYTGFCQFSRQMNRNEQFPNNT
jgi:hypothetical protein